MNGGDQTALYTFHLCGMTWIQDNLPPLASEYFPACMSLHLSGQSCCLLEIFSHFCTTVFFQVSAPPFCSFFLPRACSYDVMEFPACAGCENNQSKCRLHAKRGPCGPKAWTAPPPYWISVPFCRGAVWALRPGRPPTILNKNNRGPCGP